FIAVKHSHHNHLVNVVMSLSSDSEFLYAFVHVPRFSADECFVYLNFFTTTTKLSSEHAIMHGESDPVHHEPCALLGDSQSAVNLVRANPIFASGQHPDGSEPFVQADRGILKDASNFDTELLFGVLVLALPDSASRDKANVFTPAGWTLNTIGPALR